MSVMANLWQKEAIDVEIYGLLNIGLIHNTRTSADATAARRATGTPSPLLVLVSEV